MARARIPPDGSAVAAILRGRRAAGWWQEYTCKRIVWDARSLRGAPGGRCVGGTPGRFRAGLSPELEAFTLPRRWAVIDEAPRMKVAAPLLKRLSGDAETTYRRLHEQLRTVPVTATVLVICNPGSVPRLRLQDEAMADRLRELPYAAVPVPDPTFKARVQTDGFRRAFLARLVAPAGSCGRHGNARETAGRAATGAGRDRRAHP